MREYMGIVYGNGFLMAQQVGMSATSLVNLRRADKITFEDSCSELRVSMTGESFSFAMTADQWKALRMWLMESE